MTDALNQDNRMEPYPVAESQGDISIIPQPDERLSVLLNFKDSMAFHPEGDALYAIVHVLDAVPADSDCSACLSAVERHEFTTTPAVSEAVDMPLRDTLLTLKYLETRDEVQGAKLETTHLWTIPDEETHD